jgi:MoaA/NifB/PqqE/SkfB family radical SAM enzyme
MNNKSICAYPWRAAAIRPNGLVIPCCRYPHINDEDSYVNSPNVRKSDSWVTLRQNMLEGKPNEGCTSCYQDEDNGLTSMRLYSLKQYQPTENTIIPVEQFEVSFSNLCNLACVHCSSFFSTKWYSEDVRMNRSEKIGIVKNDFNYEKWDLSKVRDLKIIGGEPFMEQEKFVSFMKQLKLENISVQICTNGTILPNQEMLDLLVKCKRVYIAVSLDGLNGTNDWFRWPSKFNEIINNMQWYDRLAKEQTNVVPMIHHVVNLINVMELEQFMLFTKEFFPKWIIEWDWMRWPFWQRCSILPSERKNELIEQLQKLHDTYNDISHYRSNPYKVTIERLIEDNISTWSEAKNEIDKISTERKLDFLNMVPSFKEIWNIND